MGTSRRLASVIASCPHGHQSTGLEACWSKYGDVALASRFIRASLHAPDPPTYGFRNSRVELLLESVRHTRAMVRPVVTWARPCWTNVTCRGRGEHGEGEPAGP